MKNLYCFGFGIHSQFLETGVMLFIAHCNAR